MSLLSSSATCYAHRAPFKVGEACPGPEITSDEDIRSTLHGLLDRLFPLVLIIYFSEYIKENVSSTWRAYDASAFMVNMLILAHQTPRVPVLCFLERKAELSMRPSRYVLDHPRFQALIRRPRISDLRCMVPQTYAFATCRLCRFILPRTLKVRTNVLQRLPLIES